MKNIFISLLIWVVLSNTSLAQNKILGFYKTFKKGDLLELKIATDSTCQIIENEKYSKDNIGCIIHYESRYFIKNDTIVCFKQFNNKKNLIKILSDEKLMIIDFDDYFNKNDTLYISGKFSKNKDFIYKGQWKNGKKNGRWLYPYNDDFIWIIYHNNIIVDTIPIILDTCSFKW